MRVLWYIAWFEQVVEKEFCIPNHYKRTSTVYRCSARSSEERLHNNQRCTARVTPPRSSAPLINRSFRARDNSDCLLVHVTDNDRSPKKEIGREFIIEKK